MGGENERAGKSRESSVSSIDSETAFGEWMESRPRPEVKVPDDVILFQTLQLRKEPSLRVTLTKICREIPAARELAIKELLMYKDGTLPWCSDPETVSSDRSDDHPADGKSPENFEGGQREIEWRQLAAATNTPFWKQKCPKYETCRRCGEEYENLDELLGDCDYHPGRLRKNGISFLPKI